MSDQSTPGQGNVIDEIQRDHQVIEGLLAKVADSPAEGRGAAFEELAQHLAKHEAAEQAVVHPEMSAIDDDIAEDRETEESQADSMIEQLRSLDASSDEFLTLFGEFRNAVQQHAQHEESEEHPTLEQNVDPDRLAEMAEEFVQAEAEATPSS